MISTSTCLMVTADSSSASTHADSHGAGQNRPVNSGNCWSVEPVRRLLPVFAPDQVGPLGDQVAERAAVVAERHAAVHAPPGLPLQPVPAELGVHLPPVHDPHVHRPPRRDLAAGGGPTPSGLPWPRSPVQPVRRGHHGLVHVASLPLGLGGRGEDALVVLRHDPAEPACRGVPVGQQPGRDRGDPVSDRCPGASRPRRKSASSGLSGSRSASSVLTSPGSGSSR